MAPKAPYSGPWYGPHNKANARKYRGPAAIGLKRTLARAGFMPWKQYDNVYNITLEQAVAAFQKKKGIKPASGQTGLATFTALRNAKVPAGRPNAGQWAMDWVAVQCFEDAYDIANPPKPPVEQIVRESMASYMLTAENYRGDWHYTQQRAYTGLLRNPARGGYGDCSSYAVYAYGWAREETGVKVPDPAGYNYAGYGNTQSIWNLNSGRRVTDGKYLVGDMALYGPSYRTRHVSICRHAGGSGTAIFSSFGSEAGPLPTRVYYRTDLLAVVRPRLKYD